MGSSIPTMNTFARLSVVFALLVVIGSAAGRRRFCPRESRDGKECRAKKTPAQFKWGIFYENLYGENGITWVGAMPDAIRTVEKKDPSLKEKIFPKVNNKPVEKAYFVKWSSPCDADEANDNCYLLMQQLQDNKLDSCERMIGNLDGKQTIGNQLCDQAIRFLRKDKQDTSNGIRDLRLTFQKSHCGSAWSAVSSSTSGDLYLREKLCCDPNGKYYKCDGGLYNKVC